MRLGIALKLLISALGILHCNINRVNAADCEDKELYVPYTEDPSLKTYEVCFSKTGDSKLYNCPDYIFFDERTRSCTVYLDGEPMKCTSQGEKFIDPISDTCETFYECRDDMVPTFASCDANKYFNPLLQKCVPDTEYDCKYDIPDCSNPKFQNRMWVDKESCGSYYECSGDILVSRNCPPGMFFDAQTQACLFNIGDECKVQNPNPDLLVDVETMCKGNVGKFLPDPYYCRAYYYCIDESTPYWQYCNDDRYFSNGACSKTRPSSCICEDEDWDTNGKTSVNVPHSDKTKFYVCTKGKLPQIKSCPAGTTFNATKNMCVA
ncbi:unnamed protein product [Hermetia illucens]|uniref:Chitin-binding type-2 domain-containing protein n=1 Tax=Hermetia illucens TaxID=343691 RepID=A0A7R8YPB2_HERIL|nr:peritrophin-48-like [Hermetia illucens]CAD7080541.1 unnamed protein product [Hermetia illucens]